MCLSQFLELYSIQEWILMYEKKKINQEIQDPKMECRLYYMCIA